MVENAAAGTDLVQAGVTYTLGANVERLTLTGAGDIDGRGNVLANTIVGNADSNRIAGDAGSDTLSGALGADRFVFDTPLSATTNVDTVTDFAFGADVFELVSTVFTGTGLSNATLAAGMFRSGAGVVSAADADDHVILNTRNGALYYDVDGAGGQAAVQFAVVQPAAVRASINETSFFIS